MLNREQTKNLAEIRKRRKERIRSDAKDETEWITVNGTPVPLDDEGKMTGKVAEKIKKTSKSSKSNTSGSGSAASAMNEKVKKSFETGDYLDVGRTVRSALEELPIGGSFTQGDTHYIKTGEDQFVSDNDFYGNGTPCKANTNVIVNRTYPRDPETAPKFEEGKVNEAVAPKESKEPEKKKATSASEPPKNFNGGAIDVDKAQYASLKKELEKNTGKEVPNKDVDKYLDAIDAFRGSDYTDVVAASAGFSGPYEEYADTVMGESAREKASKRAESLEEFIGCADKYSGTVQRAMGFDIGGEYDMHSSQDLEDLLSSCKVGSTIDMGHTSSWTNDGGHTIDQILSARTGIDDTADYSVEVVFTCGNSRSGVDIGKYSKTLSQGEVVFSKNQKFVVRGVKKKESRNGNIRYDIEVSEK